MKSFLNLKIIISVLILALLKDFLFAFVPLEMDSVVETARYALNVLLNIYFLTFLFLYVTRIKQQKLLLAPFIVMVLVSIYFFIINQIPDSTDPMSQSDSMRQTLLASLIPASITVIAQVIIAFQLIVNTCSGGARNKLKGVGYSYVLTMLFTWMLPALDNERLFTYYREIIILIYMIPVLAYLNFYYFESKNTEDSSEIVY